jgi:hypothetical integral membrane protein (TIGR02206 family)
MRQFSPPHLAALAVMVLALAGSVPAARRRPGPWIDWFARGLALVIFLAWAGEYVYDAAIGTWTVRFTLPLQLTDVVSWCAIIALLTRRVLVVELLYYWSFTATLQAILTPDLAQTFPNVLYFTYFTYHVGAVVAAAFLVWGLGIRPRRGAVWRVFGATLAWAAVAGAADAITGGNYMYLAWKPTHASLLSVLGPWPYYIAGAAGVALALLWLVDGITRLLAIRLDPRRPGSGAVPSGSGWPTPRRALAYGARSARARRSRVSGGG